jgi:hypothetical protein
VKYLCSTRRFYQTLLFWILSQNCQEEREVVVRQMCVLLSRVGMDKSCRPPRIDGNGYSRIERYSYSIGRAQDERHQMTLLCGRASRRCLDLLQHVVTSLSAVRQGCEHLYVYAEHSNQQALTKCRRWGQYGRRRGCESRFQPLGLSQSSPVRAPCVSRELGVLPSRY